MVAGVAGVTFGAGGVVLIDGVVVGDEVGVGGPVGAVVGVVVIGWACSSARLNA